MSTEITEVTKTYRAPIESNEQVSGKLIEIEWADSKQGYKQTIPPDTAKANTNPTQMAFLSSAGNLSDLLTFMGTEFSLDLSSYQSFIVNRINGKLNFSRTKGGWSGMLAKTSKSDSEQTTMESAKEIQAVEQPKKGLSRFYRR